MTRLNLLAEEGATGGSDERVDIPDYLDMIKVYMLAILDICGTA